MVAKNTPGYLLVTVMVFSTVLFSLGLTLLQAVGSLSTTAREQVAATHALNAANAGLVRAVQCVGLDNGASWDTTTGLELNRNCNGTLNSGPSRLLDEAIWETSFNVKWSDAPGRMTLSSTGIFHSLGIEQRKTVKADVPKTSMPIDPAPTTPMELQASVPVGSALFSMGGNRACAVLSGNVYCWGSGYGSTPTALDMGAHLSGKTITQISVGESYGCVVASGKAYCWGNNGSGRLGDGTTTTRNTPVPVDTSGVLAGKTVTQISAGDTHTCAVASGRAYCWGNNVSNYGQLGNGSTVSSLVPTAVDTSGALADKTVTQVSVGWGHTCAIASGQAYCWGWNDGGLLGADYSSTGSLVPVAVDTSGVLAGKTVLAIDSDYKHNCVIASDHKMYCWGWNNFGLLGRGSDTGNTKVPGAVDTSGVLAGKTIIDMNIGYYHSCAVASDNKVYCWGYALGGRLGNGTTSGNKNSPVAVEAEGALAGKIVTGVSSRDANTCVLASAQLYCWGSGTSGKLGNGSTSSSSIPVAVSAAPMGGAVSYPVKTGDTVTVSGGSVESVGFNACFISGGKGYCQGANNYGQLGNGSTAASSEPVVVDTSGVLAGRHLVAISTSGGVTCALADDIPSSNLFCWGRNDHGQLGDGTTNQRSRPIAVNGTAFGGHKVTSVSVSVDHVCAIANFIPFCWGSGINSNTANGGPGVGFSGLGVGNAQDVLTPTMVTTTGALHNKKSYTVQTVYGGTCVIADGDVVCWGTNDYGRFTGFNNGATSSSYPSSPPPRKVEALAAKPVTMLSVQTNSETVYQSAARMCGFYGDKTPWCIGDNSGATRAAQLPPAVLTQEVADISANSYYSSCLLQVPAAVTCWGYGTNTSYALTIPSTVINEGVSRFVHGLTASGSGAPGGHCLLTLAGNLYCWKEAGSVGVIPFVPTKKLGGTTINLNQITRY